MMTEPMNPQAILFDMDGVLVDSAKAHHESFLVALRNYEIGELDYDAIAGMRTPEAVNFILQARGIPTSEATCRDVTTHKRAHYDELTKSGPPMMEGAVATVRELQARRYPLALASSGSDRSVHAFLKASGLRDAFDVVVHGGEVQRAKPDPSIFLLAASRLSVPAARTLVIEDSYAGLVAARAAGADAVAFRPSARTIAALEPLRRLERLVDVLDIVAPR